MQYVSKETMLAYFGDAYGIHLSNFTDRVESGKCKQKQTKRALSSSSLASAIPIAWQCRIEIRGDGS